MLAEAVTAAARRCASASLVPLAKQQYGYNYIALGGRSTARPLSTTSPADVVSGMLAHVRYECKGEHDKAMDVLRMGAGLELPVRERCKVLLAMSEVEADRNRWGEASSYASQAYETGNGKLQVADLAWVSRWRVGTLLAQPHAQQEAKATASMEHLDMLLLSDQTPEICIAILIVARGRAALAKYCAEGRDVELQAIIGGVPTSPEIMEESEQAFAWPGQHDAALVHLVCGNLEEGQELLEAASKGAEAQGGDAPSAMLSPASFAEIAADVTLTKAQQCLAIKDWKAAEPLLTQALVQAEAVSGDQHPRVALVLTLLGQCYAHSARPTLAEGLYRSAAQALKISDSIEQTAAAHSSACALLCWRYAQMLHVMPKREHEASKWSERAHMYWRESFTSSIESALGGLDILKGTGGRGNGGYVHMQSRRLVLCYSKDLENSG